ncbi:MAG TPA: carboxypeptidase regulatory-like domain-containing protein, partial [Solirubrobacteraceae bacterium]|nr:carboxypeptidase regulatory-like domain-containing protein [Solirubrobacteraceae bacterium]
MALAVIAGVLTALLSSAPAFAASGQITGTLTDQSGAPVAGMSVFATTVSNSLGVGASTDASGHYVVGGLDSGIYRVHFFPPGSGPNFLGRFYAGETASGTADLVTVTDGATTSGVDASLQPGAEISGIVRDSHGLPVGGVSIRIEYPGGADFGYTASGPDGRYTASGMPTGSFQLWFQPPGTSTDAPQYYGVGAPGRVSATEGQTTSGVDVVLSPGGSISGTVTGAGGAGLAGAEVRATSVRGLLAAESVTDANGDYSLIGLAAGSYAVEFVGPSAGPAYAPEYYDPQGATGTPNVVSVAAGQDTPGVDGQLQAGGAISGTVTDAAGNPLAGVSVELGRSDGSYVAGTVTAADGSYALANLDAGAYAVDFLPPAGSNYFGQYYGGGSVATSSTTVSVVGAHTTAGIDVRLVSGGSISGTVTNALGQPVAGLSVSAADGSIFDYVEPNATTDAGGHYTINRLKPGVYTVAFGGGDYAPVWYGGAIPADATRVSVAAGTVRTGIDGQVQIGGRVTGRVTDQAGHPVAAFVHISLPADAADQTEGDGLGATDADGNYAIGNLPAGTYVVSFTPLTDTLASQYYDGETFAGATRVTVRVGATTAG